jgi:hypothetical protein
MISFGKWTVETGKDTY